MTDVVKARVPPGTNTIQRRRDNTETPKHPDQSKLSAWSTPTSPVSVLELVSGAKEHSTGAVRVETLFFSSPQDQADAITEAPDADLSERLRNVLPVIAPMAEGEDFVLARVVGRLLSRSVLRAAQRVPSATSAQTDRRYDCFRNKLVAMLLDEPIEDGVTHPAEGLIDEALRADSSDCQNWLSQVLVEHYPTRLSLCASIVRCIGRLDYDRVRGWGMRVADDALRNRDAEVREAAIRALEAWGGPAAIDMLRRHKDAEVWLNEYVQQVIVDLSGTTS